MIRPIQFAFLIVFLAYSATTYCQKVTVSQEMIVQIDDEFTLIGTLGDTTLLFKEKSNSYEVQAFDKRMALWFQSELEFDMRSVKVLSVNKHKEDFSVIYRARKKGHFYVKVNKYDAACTLIDSMTILDYGFGLNSPKVKVEMSENRNIALIYHVKNLDEIHAIAFDVANMKRRWEDLIVFDDLEDSNDYQELIITDRARAYIIQDVDNSKFKAKSHHYLIYEYAAHFVKPKRFAMPMSAKLSQDVIFKFDNINKRLTGVGLYSDKSRTRSNGVFFLSFTAGDPADYIAEFSPFDESFVNTYMGSKERSSKGISNTRISNLLLRQDGGALLIAEYQKAFERPIIGGSAMRNSSQRYMVDYNIEDIMIVAFHETGIRHWESVLPKKQYSQDDDARYSSFYTFTTPSQIRLIFNDEITSDNTVSEYVFNGIGNSVRNSVLSTDNQDLRLRFQEAQQINSHEVLIPSVFKKRLKLVKITY